METSTYVIAVEVSRHSWRWICEVPNDLDVAETREGVKSLFHDLACDGSMAVRGRWSWTNCTCDEDVEVNMISRNGVTFEEIAKKKNDKKKNLVHP